MPNKKSSPHKEGTTIYLQLLWEGHNRGSHIHADQATDAAVYLPAVLEEGTEQ